MGSCSLKKNPMDDDSGKGTVNEGKQLVNKRKDNKSFFQFSICYR